MSYDSDLKYAIADAVFGNPDKPFNFSKIGAVKFGIVSIDFQRISDLATQIKVKTLSNGTHYYTLSLKESL